MDQRCTARSCVCGQEVCGITAAGLETVRKNKLLVGVVEASVSHDQSNVLSLSVSLSFKSCTT